MYDFNRLIEKYSASFLFKGVSDGHYEGGIFVPSDVDPTPMMGAIVPIKSQKIYQSGGTLTSKDKQLFCSTQLVGSLDGAKIIYKGDSFSIETDTDYTDYAEVCVYLLKWISGVSSID